jgi:hypothetical protein
MAKVRTFDIEVLQNHHEHAPPVDLAWLGKPSRHQFRWRCTKNRWHTAQRQIRSGEVLAKHSKQNTAQDMYVSTSAWLNPVNLPRIKDETSAHPVLIDHLIVFDIDIPPFSRHNMERARKATVDLLDWVEERFDFERVHVVFSGSKGFHLVYRERDRTLFSIPDPKTREHAVRDARKDLLAKVMEAGHPIDAGITADTRRIIRLPGTLHGTTGWQCTVVSEQQLRTPFKKWMNTIPRHERAIRMPRKAKKHTSEKNKQKTDEVVPIAHSTLELSSHVPGTKDRNAILAWLPRSWGPAKETVNKVQKLLDEHSIGPALLWTDNEAMLMMLPRAYPREQAAKICRKLGLLRTAESMLSNDHHWVRISPRQWENGESGREMEAVCILNRKGKQGSVTPWSAAHLELASRLDLPLSVGEEPCSGTTEPPIRIVKRK